MRYIFLILLIPSICFGRIKIGIIDTGLKKDFINKVSICRNESIDVPRKTKLIFDDVNGHGTNIAGLISNGLPENEYCFIVYKISNKINGRFDAIDIKWVIKDAIDKKVDILNMSFGGVFPDDGERSAIISALDNGVIIVAAAGNEHFNLSTRCNYFPACYDKRIVVVGAIDAHGVVRSSSNYNGPIDVYVNGEQQCGFGICMSGTSQSAAIITNIIADSIIRKKRSKFLKRWVSR